MSLEEARRITITCFKTRGNEETLFSEAVKIRKRFSSDLDTHLHKNDIIDALASS